MMMIRQLNIPVPGVIKVAGEEQVLLIEEITIMFRRHFPVIRFRKI